MAKEVLEVLIFIAGMMLSGCAVIDFLDGKHLNNSRNYGRAVDNNGYEGNSTGSHGGHSH